MRKRALFLFGIVVMGTAIFTQTVYAQEQAGGSAGRKSNAVTLDVMPLFKGAIASDSSEGVDSSYINVLALGYERNLGARYSFGVSGDLWFGEFSKDVEFTYFALAAHGRLYLLEDFSKLFIDAGLGFNSVKSDDDGAELTGLIVSLKLGWKHYFTPGFFVEPSIAYVQSKSGSSTRVAPIGWQPGLILGIAF
ncbi:MAG: hypothetical protein LBT00_05275 [Spirochaetaceae bacterium]|jgi:hypothetical protein|nr:hypothetical protein [Spirochaetaceae bacterium]